jgi:hypothetical protein
MHRLQAVLSDVRPEPPATSSGSHPAGIWEALRQRIAAWEQRRLDPEHNDAAVRQRVARQIEPFVGSAAALKIIEPAGSESGPLLNRVEVVLGEFLGRGAAASIVNRTVDDAIVKP